jgi:diaminopimelate decarboxylase
MLRVGDLIAKDNCFPRQGRGILLLFWPQVPINYSMSMNYNRNGRPPVVLVKDGHSRVIVKRENYDDIIRNDIIPEDL